MPTLLKHCCIALLLSWATSSYGEPVKVQINGLAKELEANVRANLDWAGLDSSLVSEAYLQKRLQQSEDLVKQALEPFAYYQAKVDSQLTKQAKHWLATYNVNSGPLTRLKQLQISLTGAAASDANFAQLEQNFPLQPGAPLNHALYESGKAAINKQLNALGYLDAKQRQAVIAVNKAEHSASIKLGWNSGPGYRFGSLSSNADHIDARLIQRWAPFTVSERFSYEKLLQLQRRLDSSGYFQQAEIAIDSKAASGIADITVLTTPAAKRLYRFSLGYGSDTGARAQMGFEQRWLNSLGHSFHGAVRLAEREQSYSLSYQVPALRGRAESYRYGWQRRDQQLAEYDSRSDRFSATQLSNTQNWQILWGINIESDQFTVAKQTQSAKLWYIENQWSRFSSQAPVFPSRANSLTINGRLGAGLDNEQKYFSRLHIQQHWIRPAPWAGRLILRAAAGALWSDVFDQLPPQHRFYSGGDRSVRGYAYQSLSPTDSNGEHVGGRYLAEFSTEIDYRFSQRWAGALFADAGQAFNSSDRSLAVGVGFGARFITSLLLVRIDVANAINQDQKPWRLHLSLGTDF